MSCSIRSCGCADGERRFPFAALAKGSDRARHDFLYRVLRGVCRLDRAARSRRPEPAVDPARRRPGPTAAILNYPLGTDSLGRCVLSRLIYGARTAMLVALFASLGAMIIGTVLAHISGYFGGAVDWLIGRLVDVWMSFPPVILSLILMVGLGVGLSKVILAIVLVDWTRFCRVLRSEVLIVTRHDYVAAARLLGFTHWQTIVREVLPATTAAPDHAHQPRNGDRGRGRSDPVLCRARRRRQHAGLGPDDRRRAAIRLSVAVEFAAADFGDLPDRHRVQSAWATGCAARSTCGLRKRGAEPCSPCRPRTSSVGARIDGACVPAIRALSFDLAAGKNPRPGRRIRRRQIHGRPRHRAAACRPVSQSRRARCCSKAKTSCAWRRRGGARCSAAPSPSSRRRR